MVEATIVVLTFDQRELAVAAVESALAQPASGLEVVITIDAGDPETHRLVLQAVEAHGAGPEVVIVAPAENRGPAWCYGEAVRRARGRHIAFLDGDDTWAEGMLPCQIAAIDAAPDDVVGVVGAASYGPGGRAAAGAGYVPDSETLSHPAVVGNGAKYPVLSALYRAEALRAVLPIPTHFRVCDYFVAAAITGLGRLLPSHCLCGEVRSWHGSMRATLSMPALTLDRLETVAPYLRSPSAAVRRAARLRERRLLNSLIKRPGGLPLDRMRRYLSRRPLSLRAYAALTAGYLASRS